MGSSCGKECEVLEQEVKNSANKLDTINKQMEEAVKDKGRMKAALERVAASKDAHIEDLRRELKDKELKLERSNQKIEKLQSDLAKANIGHQAMMQTVHVKFADLMTNKDQIVKELMLDMGARMERIAMENIASNERNLDKIIAMMEKMDERFIGLMTEIKNMIQVLSDRMTVSTPVPVVSSNRTSNEINYTGAQLYRMV